MKAVVTGGAGFIGSHLTDRLIQEGHTVTVLDDFSMGRKENLARHRNEPRLTVIEKDIAEDGLERYFEGADWVFHLAALADIVPSINFPLKYFHSNVQGTCQVLEAARKQAVKRFVYVASASCYGLPDSFPTREDAPIRCEYPYAQTKYLGEQLAFHWHKVYKLPVISLRFFNVYGPRSRTTGAYGAVFGVFLAQKINGKPFTVVGDGKQTRDFTYVSDAVDGLITACRSSLSGEAFNLGSGGTYSINRLVELLGGPVVHIPKRPGEPDCTFADITRIRNKLGWQPRVSFEEGVGHMKAHIEDWRKAPVWTESSIREATQDWFKYLST